MIKGDKIELIPAVLDDRKKAYGALSRKPRNPIPDHRIIPKILFSLMRSFVIKVMMNIISRDQSQKVAEGFSL